MREVHVLNLGAGVQSTCLFLMGLDPASGLRFDHSVFADTGGEPREVYEHLAHLRTLAPVLVRSAGNLAADLLAGVNSTGQKFVPIPAFTLDGTVVKPLPCDQAAQPKPKKGQGRRQCTNEYKIAVVERAVRYDVLGLKPRARIPKDVHVYQYFGITKDEEKRAERAVKRFEKTPWTTAVYPFLERGWYRSDCVKWLEGRLPHTVPRSACTFCPYRSNREWLHLKETDPDGWAQAVAIDRALRTEGVTKLMYLHRSRKPLDQVDFKKDPTAILPMLNECQGMCGV